MWGWNWLEHLVRDIRYALRMLIKNPGFTAVAVLTLALGIGANTAIFSVVNAVLLRPLPYPDPERLVMIWQTYRDFPKVEVSGPALMEWREQSRSFDQIAGYRIEAGYNLTGRGEPERVKGTFATSNLFSVLAAKAQVGRTFLADDDQKGGPPVVILSHDLWVRRFDAEPQMVGRTAELDGKSYTIVGVMPEGFRMPAWADVWLPFSQAGYGEPDHDEVTSRVRHPFQIIGHLRSGATLSEASREMDGIARRLQAHYPATDGGWGVNLVPLQAELVGNLRPALWILLAATGLVLLIACSNVSNLMLALASSRQKELAVRAALGAGRNRLVRQLLTEDLVLFLAGGAAGGALALWGVNLLVRLNPIRLAASTTLRINAQVLTFTFAVSVLTGIIFGVVPAIRAASPRLNEWLKEGGRTSGVHRQRMQVYLVVSEVGLALMLLVAAGLVVRSFFRLLHVDPGFDPHHLLTLRVSLSHGNPNLLVDRLTSLPGVAAVGAIDTLPLLRFASSPKTRFLVEGTARPPGETFPVAEIRLVDAQYFRSMNIPLITGGVLAPKDDISRGGPNHVVINQTLAEHFFRNVNPIGKRLNVEPLFLKPDFVTIVGVVGDVSHFGLDDQPRFDLYFCAPQNEMYLTVRTRIEPLSLASAVRREVQQFDHGAAVSEIDAMDHVLSDSLARRRFSMLLLGGFAVVALVLLAAGIYGVISYTTVQRTQEVGIRAALGARPSQIFRLVVGQALRLTLIGMGVGIAGALLITRFISSMLYGVRATDPATFSFVLLAIGAVAFIASYIPARRAAKVDPMVALRYE